MQEQASTRLLNIAREAVVAAVGGKGAPTFTEDDPELMGKQGCFVTLKNRGQLRGCLGCFTSNIPLYMQVAETARSSATRDPRFLSDPITIGELSSLDIEISVLSLLEKIENPLDIELGVHGIYITQGMASGCFLPQVATETGWTKEEFLGYCCAHKAGLDFDAWKDPATTVEVFTADILHLPATEDGAKQG
jgi:uncharacterized protein